jgi:flavodoxin I
MNIVVLYYSLYGNTEQVAKAIAGVLRKSYTVKLLQVTEAKLADLKSTELLIVGSPTHGGRAASVMQTFLESIPSDGLKGVKVAVFDTRFEANKSNTFLKMLMKMIDFAAPKIASLLTAKGGNLIIPPEGFFVTGKMGPLKEGESTRADAWATSLNKSKN